MQTVDLNSDVGESFGRWRIGDDTTMLTLVSSANVACGFHAGDPLTLRRCCTTAVEEGVRIGAQVGYRDLAGFGRRFVDYDRGELVADVLYQLGALDGLARVAGARVAYVKPHGALYNAAVTHEAQAGAVVEAVTAFARGTGVELPLLGLPGSALLAAGERAGLRTVAEAFADRGYTPDGGLVPRSEPGAVLGDADAVASRAVRMVRDGEVEALDGSVVRVAPDSVCVHGDSPGAVEMAEAVRRALDEARVEVRAFA